jgi:coenzyme F420-0:L-glutamate ligase/coenzyme F420-1:gamma-L-glutamate ligase
MITLIPFRTRRRSSPFNLGKLVDSLVGGEIREGDVLVISSKFMAISEGRVVRLDSVKPGARAKRLSKKYGMSPEFCELIARESDEILGGVKGFILTLRDGLLTPNAGIDRSNIEHRKVVLYPKNPLESAEKIVELERRRRRVRIAVVVSDSRLMPTRMGTVGVALAAAGLLGVRDMRGKPDLFGNPLKVTRQAIADDLCSAAQLLMGEADEGTPIVLVRGLEPALLDNLGYATKDFVIPTEQCVYMQSLGRGAFHESASDS